MSNRINFEDQGNGITVSLSETLLPFVLSAYEGNFRCEFSDLTPCKETKPCPDVTTR